MANSILQPLAALFDVVPSVTGSDPENIRQFVRLSGAAYRTLQAYAPFLFRNRAVDTDGINFFVLYDTGNPEKDGPWMASLVAAIHQAALADPTIVRDGSATQLKKEYAKRADKRVPVTGTLEARPNPRRPDGSVKKLDYYQPLELLLRIEMNESGQPRLTVGSPRTEGGDDAVAALREYDEQLMALGSAANF
jgi:hypothetical protein